MAAECLVTSLRPSGNSNCTNGWRARCSLLGPGGPPRCNTCPPLGSHDGPRSPRPGFLAARGRCAWDRLPPFVGWGEVFTSRARTGLESRPAERCVCVWAGGSALPTQAKRPHHCQRLPPRSGAPSQRGPPAVLSSTLGRHQRCAGVVRSAPAPAWARVGGCSGYRKRPGCHVRSTASTESAQRGRVSLRPLPSQPPTRTCRRRPSALPRVCLGTQPGAGSAVLLGGTTTAGSAQQRRTAPRSRGTSGLHHGGRMPVCRHPCVVS